MSKAEPRPGEHWAYRWHGPDPVDEVEILQIGSKSPPRVLVRFIATEQEGREDWVPPGRLKVLWAGRAVFLERERNWDRVRVVKLRETPTAWAIDILFEALDEWKLAHECWNADSGILRIPDVDALATDLGLARDDITADPRSFHDDGELIVPWTTGETIVRAMALRYADTILPHVEKLEQEAQIHNRWGSDHGDHHISAEICAETDIEFGQARELVRQWCGEQGRARQDELHALREEVHRLGLLIEDAVTALRAAEGEASQTALRIERELGVPVAQIRAERIDAQRRARRGY